MIYVLGGGILFALGLLSVGLLACAAASAEANIEPGLEKRLVSKRERNGTRI